MNMLDMRANEVETQLVDAVAAALKSRLARPIPAYLRRDRRGSGGLAAWQENRVARHIVDNADRPLRVSKLADLAGLSSSHFSRAFRASFGLSPHKMLAHHRIMQAKHLLLSTDLPLSEIASACGYVDQSHFSRRFHRHTSTSPGRWRRDHQCPPISKGQVHA
ncbi:hypothetical protein ASC89_07500 [Devosia sp. Root413D1]|uniref:helix-turn-helix domain-containing protein n=1 Tax=Devosia sp. Root413D1 TaxID=1736531 RepID=UPI0006FB26DA|nr:AraC family transcriptional regulator [Devosia sp. Root413D1]KQW81642.1 hypothetical protein ASC89_07500 [Devosia sp. Root413D1]